ncbi:hypothetical protein [Methylibium petroleiphilum]|nr:hypothetical protein [Methylibium petroleiphilum]
MSTSTANHQRFTVLLRNEHRERLRYLQSLTGSPSENAVLIALLVETSDEECKRLYEQALERGSIAPKQRLSQQQRQLLHAVKHASPERLAAALAAVEAHQD